MSIKDYPSTSLLSHIFITIFGIHMVLAKGTVKIVELYTIQ